jgi:hypothetical protein
MKIKLKKGDELKFGDDALSIIYVAKEEETLDLPPAIASHVLLNGNKIKSWKLLEMQKD